MKLLSTRAFWAALALSVCATAAHAGPDKITFLPLPGNTPDQTSDAAAPLVEAPEVRCVLRAENNQTQFRQGETIHLIASFTSDRPGYQISRFVRNDRSLAKLGEISVTPAENVSDPLGELPPPMGMGFAGNVPRPENLSAEPVEFPFVLNNWARFDKPGTYQITLTTTRVSKLKEGEGEDEENSLSFLFSPRSYFKTVSAPLPIEIVSADQNWQDEQVALWRAHWSQPAAPYGAGEPPRNDIGFVGTRAAMTAIVEHLGQIKTPRSSEDDSGVYRIGLIGFADRDWLIGEMERFIERPDYAVTPGFFDLRLELQNLQGEPRPAGADATLVQYEKDATGQMVELKPTPAQQLQRDWLKRRGQEAQQIWLRDWLQTADAVERKTGAARAMTLYSLLESAWSRQRDQEPLVAARLPQLVAQLAPVFDQLPPLPRAYLLGDSWPRIQSPAFAPALERTWDAPAPPDAQDDYKTRDADDLTLRRLYELDPPRGRALILEQIQQPKPRVSFAALSVLPDATLPALDAVLATQFEAAQTYDNALTARLISRYSTGAELPRLKRLFEASGQNMEADTLASMLAYFLRVEPAYGEAQLEIALRTYRDREYSALLSSVAAQQMSPTLEQVAVAYLSDAGLGVETDAATTLARYGSPAAQAALMARLKSPADNADGADNQKRAQLESRFVEALANAQNWLAPPTQLRQIRELCQTDEGRRVADDYIRARTNGEPLTINYSAGSYESWSVDHYNGRSLKDLRAKLAQFPRGTEFFWQMTSYGPEADRAFEETQKWAVERGLKIRPYDEIGARRQELGLG